MFEIALFILAGLVPAIVLHEYAHGWAADVLGDPTPRRAGRLSLNPLRHVDPVGSVLVPGALFLLYYLHFTPTLYLFGWAKPVPVSLRELRHPRRDMMLVAMAGPAMNIILAMLLAQAFGWSVLYPVSELLFWAIEMNLMLAVFNLIPIPPLDGSRIVSGLIPVKWARVYNRVEPFGIFIMLVLMNAGMLRFMVPFIEFLTLLLGVRL